MTTALTIAGSDSGGGAGIQADLKTFQAMGVHGASVLTSLTAQNTLAVRDIFDLPVEFIRAQFAAVSDDFDIKAAKTGMLSTREIIECVAENVGNYLLVVDPVMVAQSGGKLLKDDAVEALENLLLPKAAIATPNIPEAEVLSGIEIKEIDDVKEACRIISKHGCSVLIKGGHSTGDEVIDILHHNGDFHEFSSKRIGEGVHGSGCAFASAIAAGIAKGEDVVTAVGGAKSFITRAIETAYSPGRGPRVVNPIGRPIITTSEDLIISELRKVVSKIEHIDFYKVTPEVGSNIAYAREGAKALGDVAAIEGRIVKVKERVLAVGDVVFGGSKHVATIVLGVMHFDQAFRCAMNIKYKESTLGVCERLGFTISDFNREEEPKEKSTMEWGTMQAIKKKGSVPDIIYDKGSVGKEPMIRIIGKSPQEVFEKLARILNEA
jgi:hydroxymethylpyrimidine/phosphomethylpyrimidine kinase